MNMITIDRSIVQQALEALEKSVAAMRGLYGDWRCESALKQVDTQITALRTALAQPVPHGCHVDLDHGMKPDGCVLDDGRPENCIYAKRLLREGKDKTACEYWQPIKVMR